MRSSFFSSTLTFSRTLLIIIMLLCFHYFEQFRKHIKESFERKVLLGFGWKLFKEKCRYFTRNMTINACKAEKEMFKQSCQRCSVSRPGEERLRSFLVLKVTIQYHSTTIPQYHSTTPSYSHHARLLNKITNKSVGQWSCCNVFYIDNGYAGLEPWCYQSDDIKSVLITTKTSRQTAGPDWYS